MIIFAVVASDDGAISCSSNSIELSISDAEIDSTVDEDGWDGAGEYGKGMV